MLAAAFFFLFLGKLAAQRPTGDGGRPPLNFPQQAEARADSVPQNFEPELPDTTPLRFSFCQKPELLFLDNDTLPDAAFRFYDPARRGFLDKKFQPTPFDFLPPNEWANLGNPGSAARPFFYQHFSKIGFSTGINAFNLYETGADQLRFYRHSRAFSEAVYSQGFGKQSDSQFRGKFARTFSDGVNFSLQYDALNGVGQLQNQRNKNSAFAVGLWQQFGTRYEAFLIYAKNSHKQQENGGILDESQFFEAGVVGGNNEISVRQTSPFPVSALKKSDIQFTQHLLFLGKNETAATDSTGPKMSPNRDFRLVHSARYGTEIFKFYDKASPLDSALYGPFWTDERGLRNYFTTRTIENRAALAFSGGKKTGGDLEIGLKHQFVRLDKETATDDFQQLFFTGNSGFRIADRLKLNTAADLGFGKKNGGEYSIRADAGLDFGKFGELRGGLLNQRRLPSLVQNRLQVSQIPVWENGFNKIIETTLAVSWAVPRLGFSVTGQNHLANNFIFFNKYQLPEQLGSALNVAQLIVNQRFKVRGWRLDNQFVFQRTNQNDILHQPEWATRNSLYFDGKIIHRRLYLAAGADFRMNQSFAADGWQPAAGQFFLQDTLVAAYSSVDVFAAMNVKNFRFFVRYENLSKLWENRVFYQTERHPQPRGYIRFGVSFRWMDGRRVAEKQETQGQPSSRPRPN